MTKIQLDDYGNFLCPRCGTVMQATASAMIYSIPIYMDRELGYQMDVHDGVIGFCNVGTLVCPNDGTGIPFDEIEYEATWDE